MTVRHWRFSAPTFRENVVLSSLKSRNMSKKKIYDTLNMRFLYCLKYFGTRYPATDNLPIPLQKPKNSCNKRVHIAEYVTESGNLARLL